MDGDGDVSQVDLLGHGRRVGQVGTAAQGADAAAIAAAAVAAQRADAAAAAIAVAAAQGADAVGEGSRHQQARGQHAGQGDP